ncbi:MAG: M20 family metallopeptidase [Candidatus Thorarchaeota archaeon]|jgi:acetylornithine deacetylase/succinyl-diaminopimelate desuccinylase family protein
MTDAGRLISLTQELVAANSESPPGGEEEVAKVLQSHMEDHGISCVSIGPGNRPNLLFSTIEGEKGPLVIHGHMDTVPAGPRESWKHDPFGGEIVDGLLYGRGAADMKGPVAALAETMIQYNEEGHKTPLLMLATSDEETGCTGAEEVAKSGRLEGVQYGVCAEPTSLNVLVGEKGIFWSRIVTKGKAAHGSRPEEGVNAIQLCIQALEVLASSPYSYEPDSLLGTQTMNIGYIQGGTKVNVVPDSCEARLDMRIVKGQTPEDLLDTMNKRLETAGLSDRAKVEYIHGKPAVVTPYESEIVSIAIDTVYRITGIEPKPAAATYGTDCSVLQPKIGIINVICGPGSIEQAHQPDEFIDVEQLVQSVDVYLGIARHFSNTQ